MTTAILPIQESRSVRFAICCSNWAERWFPDSWALTALAIPIVSLAALAMGAGLIAMAKVFDDGF